MLVRLLPYLDCGRLALTAISESDNGTSASGKQSLYLIINTQASIYHALRRDFEQLQRDPLSCSAKSRSLHYTYTYLLRMPVFDGDYRCRSAQRSASASKFGHASYLSRSTTFTCISSRHIIHQGQSDRPPILIVIMTSSI